MLHAFIRHTVYLSFPLFFMTDSSDSSGMSAMVAIIAIVAILAIGYVAFRMLPAMGTGDGSSINIDLPNGQNSSN